MGKEEIDWFDGEYHTACGPCGTILPRMEGRERGSEWWNEKLRELTQKREMCGFVLKTGY